jgi:hypothetical protein
VNLFTFQNSEFWGVTGDGRDLVGVRFDAGHSDVVRQELAPGDPKVHFSGFNLMLNHWRLLKVSSRSEMRLLSFEILSRCHRHKPRGCALFALLSKNAYATGM